MVKKRLENKISILEGELVLLKKSLARRKIDFTIDENNWKKVKPAAKKIRSKLFKELYG